MVVTSHTPYRFLVVGNGRLASHLKHYLNILQLPFMEWNRSLSLSELHSSLARCSHVLLCISDSALSSFYEEHLQTFKGKCVHFSGALDIPSIVSVHPLMSFAHELYTDETYFQIPFVTTSNLNLGEILPGLKNHLFRIKPEEKAYYHALCVLGGNLTNLLMSKMLAGFTELRLPPDIAQLYLQQVVKNVLSDPLHSLTGPLARKDINTIKKNLQSLENSPFVNIYKSFLPLAFPELDKESYENPRF